MAEEHIPESGASPKDPELGDSDGTPENVGEAAEPGASTPEPEGSPAPPVSAAGSGSAGKPAAVALTPGQRLAAKKAAKAVDKREFKEELKRSADEARQKEQAEADQLLGRARPEPALPAEVEQVASTFSHFLQDNRERILLGVAALVAIAAVSFGAARFMRSGAAEQAAQLGKALELANAPLDPDDTDGKSDDGKPVFKTEQDRATKALAAFDDVALANADDQAAVWAKLAGAAQQIQLGKYDEARARFQSVYDAHAKETALAARALEGVAIAQEAAGKQDDALKTYDKLKYVEGSKDLAEFEIARIKLARGDREGAKGMLKALYDQLTAPAVEGATPSRYLRAEVEVRLAELDSKLVDKGSSLGGGDSQQFTDEQIQKLLQQLQKQGGGQPGTGGP